MLIKVEGLKKAYTLEIVPVRDVSCEVEEGEVISIIGPSGTGKSTFLNLLNRMETPTAGRIWFDGEDTTAPHYDLNRLREKMGMVFQSFNLFSHLNIAENIMLGPVRLKGVSRQDAYDRAMRLLDTVGLRQLALKYPKELSGGQQQRVAIVRAMAMEPRVLLFDEPTSALDPTLVGEVLSVIRNLAQQGITMLIVTHEMSFAREVSSRVFYMDEGVIYESGSPDQIFDHPQREKTRQFVRHIKSCFWAAEDCGWDPASLFTALDSFARRNLLAPSLDRKLRVFIEELLSQLSGLRKAPGDYLHISVEYMEKENQGQVDVTWSGPSFDPLSSGDEISLLLLRHTCPDASWSRENDVNRIIGRV